MATEEGSHRGLQQTAANRKTHCGLHRPLKGRQALTDHVKGDVREGGGVREAQVTPSHSKEFNSESNSARENAEVAAAAPVVLQAEAPNSVHMRRSGSRASKLPFKEDMRTVQNYR